jgi:5-methylcytosine-specific restriction protein A
MRNPTWQRDELILALNLYFDAGYNTVNNKHSEVINLSQILNRLPIFSEEQRTITFRNPEGVYMKLGNFLSIDPNDARKGLLSYGKLDEEVFYEFTDRRKELKQIALLIKESISESSSYTLIKTMHNEYNYEELFAKEGKIFYRLHRLRERDPTLAKKKKQHILEITGKLECEICEFDFHSTYGNLGEGFIECHHNKPVSRMKLDDVTRLNDLSLVCSNCHRMLHRKLTLSVKSLKELIKKKG